MLCLEVILTLFFSCRLFKHSRMVLVLSAIADYWEIILRQLLVMVPKLFSVPLFLIEDHDLPPDVLHSKVLYFTGGS